MIMINKIFKDFAKYKEDNNLEWNEDADTVRI